MKNSNVYIVLRSSKSMEGEVNSAYFKRVNSFAKKDKLRREAAFGSNALEYYNLCQELGIDYEKPFRDLYFEGAHLASEETANKLEDKIKSSGKSNIELVLSSISPKVIYSARNSRSLLKKIFRELDKEGIVEMEKIEKMDTTGLVNKYMSMRKEYGVFS